MPKKSLTFIKITEEMTDEEIAEISQQLFEALTKKREADEEE